MTARTDKREHELVLRRERQKRYRQRNKVGHRVRRFLDTGELRNALCSIGLLSQSEADQDIGAELGVARLLRRLEEDAEVFRYALLGQRRF